jgi:hypothetical protein
MKHLKVLEQAELISSTRQGRTRWNYLHEDLAQLLRTKLTGDEEPYRLAEVLGMLPQMEKVDQTTAVAPPLKKIEQRILLQAPPAQVFEAFTGGVDSWWSRRESAGSHVFLEPVINGRFYEAFSTAGEGVLYGIVTYSKRGVELRLQGTSEFGQQMAGTFIGDSHLCATFEQQEADTLLYLTHDVAGSVDEEAAERIRLSWRQLLDQHFQPYVEQGLPAQHDP